MHVLAVDPGKATGWVYAEVRVTPEGREVIPLAWAEDDPATFALTASRLLSGETEHGVDQVVCESWKPRGGPLSHQPDALELIGWLRHTCGLSGVRFNVSQDPAFALKMRPAAVKALPAVGRGGEGHAKMALSHLWGWVQTADEEELS